ncbi:packaged DNA stabilization protein [Stenotrophomonas maltophilia]|uniref:packaged DNA stabilization protein n=1 Tax=Stenotrophomonas maltophilia TaxID=40324 RepID=UPI0015F21193|nr:packaged DNA stabilization protein [Stenotrophomonas maltophilia]QDY48795.1 hypothetical protein DUW70_09735 [Stenotrophomonas maltophilia]
MRAQPVDLIGGFYTSDSLPWSCQDTVNWLPVMAEVAGTRTVSMFATPPGLKPYQRIGGGPIRGMHDCEGLRLIVSGRILYRIGSDGVGVPLGTIPGVGRVQMTHNQFSTGYQVLVENGQGGGGYVYNTVDGTFAKITDEGYPGSISSDYLDSYLLGVEPLGRFWFHSNLADATDYNTLDRYEAEASPDKIVGLAVSQFEVVVFGQRTIEFFFNAGGQTGTFQNRRQSITRGCASRHTIQKLDNTLFWLGDDGVVYRMEGYAARPVSTRALEKAISGYNWAEAIAFTWEDRGHKVYYLTFPDGQTFGYDVVSGLWHRRESFGINRWRLSHTQKWGRDWFGGDFQNGRIWQLDWDYFLEGDQPIISERVSGVTSDNQSAVVIPNAELIFDTGQGPGTTPITFPVQPTAPVVTGAAPDGFVNFPYTFTYTATGGTGALRFSIHSDTGGAVPGVSIDANTGVATFSAASAGTTRFYVRATDSLGIWGEVYDTIQIADRLPYLDFVVTPVSPAITAKRYDANTKAISDTASATMPAGESRWAVASGSVYFAAGTNSPYLYAWKLNGAVLTPLAAPASPPPGQGQTLAIFGDVLFVGHEVAPFISAYKFNQTTGIVSKYPAPSPAPTGLVRSISVHPSGAYVALVSDASPKVTAYQWDAVTGFGARLTSPPVVPTGTATGIAFNESGTHVAVSSISDPVVRIYQWNSGFGAVSGSLNNPIFGSRSVALSDKAGLVVCGSEGGGASALIYRWSAQTGVGAQIPQPPNFVTISRSVAISSDGKAVAFTSSGTDGMGICEWDKDSGVLSSPTKSGANGNASVQFKA